MIALYVVLSALLVFIAVILVRTLLFKPKKLDEIMCEPVAVDSASVAASLSEMIKCKTVSSYKEELEDEAEFIKFEEKLKSLFPNVHAKCSLMKPTKRAILYKWAGESPKEPVVLMSHYDVVSADEDKWEKPAFSGLIEDGFIWGRGAIDTKCTLNGIMQAAESLIKEGFVPKADVYFAFGGNEEISGNGAPSIVNYFRENGITPGFVLDEGGAVVSDVFPGVKEPCALIGIAEKGMVNIEYSVKSSGGHASAPLSKTPIGMLSRACAKLEKKPLKFTVTSPAKMLFDNLARRSSFIYRMIFANLWCFAPLLNKISAKSGGQMNALLRTTVAFTEMMADEGMNVIPTEAKMISNSRIIPGETVESVVARVKKCVNNPAIEIKAINGNNPSRISDVQTYVYKNLEKVIRESFDGVAVSPYLMIACSDSRHFSRISDKVYRFSPFILTKEGNESIHGNNEKISQDSAAKIVEFYIRLIKSF